MIEAFRRLQEIATQHLVRYRVMGQHDMYWAGRRDEAGYWRDMISNCLPQREIEIPAERLEILE